MSDDLIRLDLDGRVAGTVDKTTAHADPLVPHLAFSVFVFDPDGRLLLQRRAAGKQTFPGLWSNSCCSHPRPGEPLQASVRRRVLEELGITIDSFELKGGFWYRALDHGGWGEHEYDLVLVCTVEDLALEPDPDEVSAVQWLEPRAGRWSTAGLKPGVTPWFDRALEIALGAGQDVAVDIPR